MSPSALLRYWPTWCLLSDLTSVTLILLEGDRKGPVIARVEGWESRAFSFARTDWHKAIDHPQLGSLLTEPGVYVLVGRSPVPWRARVYVGQADVLRSRLGTHLASPPMVWWEQVYVFVGGLHKTSISWLESELIHDAKAAGRSDVENGPQPNRPQILWEMKQSMTQHYQRARLLLGLLGLDAFDPLSPAVPMPLLPAILGASAPTKAGVSASLPSDLTPPGAGEAIPTLTSKNVYIVVGEAEDSWRRWEDWISYGLVSGGLTAKIGKAMDKIKTGDRIFAYLSGHGYVGVGIAVADAAPIGSATAWGPAGGLVPVLDLPAAKGWAPTMGLDDPAITERVVRVRWLKTAARDKGFFEKGIFAGPMTTCSLLDKKTIQLVLDHFELSPVD